MATVRDRFVTREEFDVLSKQINALFPGTEEFKESTTAKTDDKTSQVTRKEFEALSKRFEALSSSHTPAVQEKKWEVKPPLFHYSIEYENKTDKAEFMAFFGSLGVIGFGIPLFLFGSHVSVPLFIGSTLLTGYGYKTIPGWIPPKEDIDNYVAGRTVPETLRTKDRKSISKEQAIKELILLRELMYGIYKRWKKDLWETNYSIKEEEEAMKLFKIDKKTVSKLMGELEVHLRRGGEPFEERMMEKHFEEGPHDDPHLDYDY